jgi:hypothetical protein
LNLTPDWDLTGDIGTNWIEPTYRPGTTVNTRRSLEPGETFKNRQGFLAPMPMTASNDERDLPSSFTGKPMFSLPKEDYPGSFPHTTIPYEAMKRAVSPEIGMTPSGWMPIQKLANEERRAVAAAMPSPWSSPENMAVDISGLSGFGDDGLIFTSEGDLEAAEQATAEAYQQTIDENPEKKDDPGWLAQAWALAVGAGTRWLASQTAKTPTTPALTTTSGAFAAAAAARVSTPFYKKPLVIGIGIVALGGVIYLVTRKRKG